MTHGSVWNPLTCGSLRALPFLVASLVLCSNWCHAWRVVWRVPSGKIDQDKNTTTPPTDKCPENGGHVSVVLRTMSAWTRVRRSPDMSGKFRTHVRRSPDHVRPDTCPDFSGQCPLFSGHLPICCTYLGQFSQMARATPYNGCIAQVMLRTRCAHFQHLHPQALNTPWPTDAVLAALRAARLLSLV